MWPISWPWQPSPSAADAGRADKKATAVALMPDAARESCAHERPATSRALPPRLRRCERVFRRTLAQPAGPDNGPGPEAERGAQPRAEIRHGTRQCPEPCAGFRCGTGWPRDHRTGFWHGSWDASKGCAGSRCVEPDAAMSAAGFRRGKAEGRGCCAEIWRSSAELETRCAESRCGMAHGPGCCTGFWPGTAHAPARRAGFWREVPDSPGCCAGFLGVTSHRSAGCTEG